MLWFGGYLLRFHLASNWSWNNKRNIPEISSGVHGFTGKTVIHVHVYESVISHSLQYLSQEPSKTLVIHKPLFLLSSACVICEVVKMYHLYGMCTYVSPCLVYNNSRGSCRPQLIFLVYNVNGAIDSIFLRIYEVK